MKKIVIIIILSLGILRAQNPGLIISEIFVNPAGSDSPFEFVEFIASNNINFATTPYTIIVNNNGIATANGWVNGGVITYAFEINTGSVTAGQVYYVGGSSMTPTTNILRAINTATTGGDGGIGTAALGGVFGNGGANADGIAVFNLPIASITSSTVPVDAIFWGTGVGTALVSGGTQGYELPVNDTYIGGKLQSTSFVAADPGANYLVATGTFNTTTNTYNVPRAWTSSTTFTNSTSSVSLVSVAPPPVVSFSSLSQRVNENVGTANITMSITSPNSLPCKVVLQTSVYTTTTAGLDYTVVNDTITFPASSSANQSMVLNIINDTIKENAEYVSFKVATIINGTVGANNYHILYINDDDYVAPQPTNEVFLNLLTSFSNGASGTNSAEIVDFDPTVDKLFIANSIGQKIDFVNFSNPSSPSIITSINISAVGNINSIASKNGIVAVALEALNPQDSGYVQFYTHNGVLLKQLRVGAMPDMIKFNHSGTKVLLACEGEPNAAYTVDPEGHVCIVNISGGIASLTQANVTFIGFTSYNSQQASLIANGIRIYGLAATVAKNFEPEYIDVYENDSFAIVGLQENNAIVKINLLADTIVSIIPLGFQNYASGNAMDVSDLSIGVNIASYPVRGYYLPDAIDQFNINNANYFITANEGDARAYTGYSEESRISALNLDPVAYPDQNILKSNFMLGRLNATNANGDIDNDGDIDQIYVYGTRSFTIRNTSDGSVVFDSKNLIESIIAQNPTFSAMFNASNGGSIAVKNRSDDKGPEPEGVTIADINENKIAFVSLERIGGVMLFNIDNPANPRYIGYYNNRSIATNGPDRGAEGILFIKPEDSPNNRPILILANEISSTLSIYSVTSCADSILVSTSVTPNDSVCSGNTVSLSVNTIPSSTIQWRLNNSNIAGETSTSYLASATGEYSVALNNTSLQCKDTIKVSNVTINPLPIVGASSPTPNICIGASATLNATGATSYTWMPGSLSGASVSVSPTTTTTYTVTGIGTTGCQNTTTLTINVSSTPTVTASSSTSTICNGSSTTLNGAGASTYAWMPGSLSGTSVTVSPTTTTTYTVTGTNIGGCSSTGTVTINVNSLPTVTASTPTPTICNGGSSILNASGASTYTWMPGSLSGASVPTLPITTTTYTVTGTNAAGCQNTATVTITVNPIPTLGASSPTPTICNGSSATLNATGASTYTWMPGSLSGSSVLVSPTSSTTYVVTGTSAAGCNTTATVTIVVNPIPTVTAVASTSSICDSESTTLNGSGASTYTWMPGSLSGPSVSVSPSTSTTYTVTGSSAGCSNTGTIMITVNPLPNVTASSSNLTICDGESTTLNGSGASTYTWTPGSLSGASVSVSPPTTTTYTLTGTDGVGCDNSETVTITVNPLPNPVITNSSGTLNTGTFATYQWLQNGTPIAGSTSNSHVVSSNGSYQVIVTNTDGCSDTSEVTLIENFSLEHVNTSMINLFPNPTSEYIIINSDLTGTNNTLYVYDVHGKLLVEYPQYMFGNKLDVSSLSSGLYFVVIMNNSELYKLKFIVQHKVD